MRPSAAPANIAPMPTTGLSDSGVGDPMRDELRGLLRDDLTLKRAIIAKEREFRAEAIVIEDESLRTQLIQGLQTRAPTRSLNTSPRPAPTRPCACIPARTGSRTAASFFLNVRRDSTSTSLSSTAFRARSTTTRSIPLARRSTIFANRTSSSYTCRRSTDRRAPERSRRRAPGRTKARPSGHGEGGRRPEGLTLTRRVGVVGSHRQ